MTAVAEQAYLTADELVQLAGCPEEDVYIPEWDRTARVRGLTYGELVALPHGGTDVSVEMRKLVLGLVHPRLKIEQIPYLERLPSGIVHRLVRAIDRLSGEEAS